MAHHPSIVQLKEDVGMAARTSGRSTKMKATLAAIAGFLMIGVGGYLYWQTVIAGKRSPETIAFVGGGATVRFHDVEIEARNQFSPVDKTGHPDAQSAIDANRMCPKPVSQGGYLSGNVQLFSVNGQSVCIQQGQ